MPLRAGVARPRSGIGSGRVSSVRTALCTVFFLNFFRIGCEIADAFGFWGKWRAESKAKYCPAAITDEFRNDMCWRRGGIQAHPAKSILWVAREPGRARGPGLLYACRGSLRHPQRRDVHVGLRGHLRGSDGRPLRGPSSATEGRFVQGSKGALTGRNYAKGKSVSARMGARAAIT